MSAAVSSPYLTLDEAAAYLRVDEKTLRRHVMRQIVPLTIGRRKFYTTEMLDEWHDRKKAGSFDRRDEQGSRTRSASGTRRGAIVKSPRVRATLEKLQGKLSASTSPNSPPDPSPNEDASIPPSGSTNS